MGAANNNVVRRRFKRVRQRAASGPSAAGVIRRRKGGRSIEISRLQDRPTRLDAPLEGHVIDNGACPPNRSIGRCAKDPPSWGQCVDLDAPKRGPFVWRQRGNPKPVAASPLSTETTRRTREPPPARRRLTARPGHTFDPRTESIDRSTAPVLDVHRSMASNGVV